MKTKALAFTALVAAALTVVPTYAYATCVPSKEQLTRVSRAMGEEMTRLAPLQAGADHADVTWVKENIVRMVPDWLPATQRVATRAKPEIDKLVDDCYQPGDYTTASPARAEFVGCAKRALVTELAPAHLPEWGALCVEMRDTFADPAIESKVRSWTRQWADAYLDHKR